jgi:hypothetical protein
MFSHIYNNDLAIAYDWLLVHRNVRMIGQSIFNETTLQVKYSEFF